MTLPLTGWTARLFEGNTHCQAHSLLAFGYFFSKGSGSVVPSYPFAKSWSCIRLILCKCDYRDSLILSGRIVVLSFSPFPERTISKLLARSISLTLKRMHSNKFREVFSLIVQSMLPGWILGPSNIRLAIQYE